MKGTVTIQQLLKIAGWTVGMSIAAVLVFGKGLSSNAEFAARLVIGAFVGLILGILFAKRLPKPAK